MQHHRLVRRELARFRGHEHDTAGDGFVASFDGPARAIRCACAIADTVLGLGLEVRAGLHTGECERSGGKVGGITVHIGARVAASAQPGEVLSSTVEISSPAPGSRVADVLSSREIGVGSRLDVKLSRAGWWRLACER